MRLVFMVSPMDEGRVLKRFIRSRGLSAGMWKRIKWHGRVSIDGREIHNANEIIHTGSMVVCEWREEPDVVPTDIDLSVVYEDNDLLVVNKPAYMLIHPTHEGGIDTLVNGVANHYRLCGKEGGIHPLYRLDRNTTGLVVVAKSSWAQYALSKSHDLVYREYVAVVKGHMKVPLGIINAPIGRKDGSVVEWMVRSDGKPAQTEFTVIGYGEDYTVVRLHLLSGRTHQIRVHLSWLGYPLLGDDLYGGDLSLIDRQALHARTVRFIHPATQKMITLSAPIPSDMECFMEGLR